MGETASPERSAGECRGGRTSPRAKALENKGLNGGSEKKCPLSVNRFAEWTTGSPNIYQNPFKKCNPVIKNSERQEQEVKEIADYAISGKTSG